VVGKERCRRREKLDELGCGTQATLSQFGQVTVIESESTRFLGLAVFRGRFSRLGPFQRKGAKPQRRKAKGREAKGGEAKRRKAARLKNHSMMDQIIHPFDTSSLALAWCRKAFTTNLFDLPRLSD
jgi:hypothetical protein